LEANDKANLLFCRTKTNPLAMFNAPTTETMTINSSFCKTNARFAALVTVNIMQARTDKPVKTTNPPKAVLNR
jgi:hypothetical protein